MSDGNTLPPTARNSFREEATYIAPTTAASTSFFLQHHQHTPGSDTMPARTKDRKVPELATKKDTMPPTDVTNRSSSKEKEDQVDSPMGDMPPTDVGPQSGFKSQENQVDTPRAENTAGQWCFTFHTSKI